MKIVVDKSEHCESSSSTIVKGMKLATHKWNLDSCQLVHLFLYNGVNEESLLSMVRVIGYLSRAKA